MARQKSERRVVPEGRRKSVVTQANEQPGGGKAAPVIHSMQQLALNFETAGGPQSKSKDEPERASAATMEQICEQLERAFKRVAANKGAPGPDGRSIARVREHRPAVLDHLRQNLLTGQYEPGNVRRVWIPKAAGGQRGLGIPNVVDRVVQEAVRMVLEPVYEPTFHNASHGFRPGRGCHSAIKAARQHLAKGSRWVVDLDLEKFFDRVNHQRLMNRLAQRINDRRVLVLIGQMLKAGVIMPDGVVVATAEGVPQGGPLSPLLSNIVLDELDQELGRRGHRFVRYADDCNIYVRSEQAGRRVMASVTRFIERRLRLKVNASKSAVARPQERHFLGFTLRRNGWSGAADVLLSKRSQERLAARVVALTPRKWGNSLNACIRRVNKYLRGWLNYFGICTHRIENLLQRVDAHLRCRLRAIQVSHWKRKRSMARGLIRLGVNRTRAWQQVYAGRKSTWALSHELVMGQAMNLAYFAERGLISLAETWRAETRAAQRRLDG
jgi:RNA-directed DNA polymerase